MNQASANASSHHDRRRSPRHYLVTPRRAELIYGRQRIAVASGSICDVSQGGIGLHTAGSLRLPSGALVTVAVPSAGKVLTVSGKVAAVRHGFEVGICIDGTAPALLDMFGSNAEGVTISTPQHGKAAVSGKLSMSARHPVRWAVAGGAQRLDLAAVGAIDSCGIGLLLQVNERHGITVEKCSPQVCRLVKLCMSTALCAADCPRA